MHSARVVSLLALAAFCLPATSGNAEPVRTQLAGKSIQAFPYFRHVRAFSPQTTVEAAVDPGRFPSIVGSSCDVYVVAAKDPAAWATSPTLTDVRAGGPQTRTFAGSLGQNIFDLAAPGELNGDPAPGLGVGYDVVLDCDRDGLLGAQDYIDGLSEEAGLYAVHDTTAPGPFLTKVALYSGGGWLTQKTYYPRNIATLGQLPLVIVAHGWTHEYTFYDHIGHHLASYGYIVMAHTNDVGGGGPKGTLSAATTTLDNTDYLLDNLDTIAGGVLNGHVDAGRIVFIGHSTGGEAVVHAYTLMRTGNYTPVHFGVDDVVLISSIAPVVWFSRITVDPFDVNYHMFVGAADTDATGAPIDDYVQSMTIYERSTGNRHLVYVQGAGHADFHDGGGSSWATGPDLIGRAATHAVVKGYYLPLMELYTRDNPAARDFFDRMYDDFHPLGIPDNVVVSTESRHGLEAANFVVDDFETNPDTGTSSSGGGVSFFAPHLDEILMRDQDGSFDFAAGQPSNGMTRSRFGDDLSHAVVLDWNPASPAHYEIEIIPPQRDLSDDEFLSFRACQGTRHPETDALNGPLGFTVSLRDGSGVTASIRLDTHGELPRPYLRTGYGSGAGWGNEFATVRMRLTDFVADGSGLDLTDIVAVRFDFGVGFGSERGRVGIDDVEITNPEAPGPFELAVGRDGPITRLSWSRAPGALFYDVLRGTIPHAGLGARGTGAAAYDHTCHESADARGDGLRVSGDDDPVPIDRAGFYYLVAVVTTAGAQPPGQANTDLDPAAPGIQVDRPPAACPGPPPTRAGHQAISKRKAIRGGSFLDGISALRLDARQARSAGARFAHVGFRIVMEAE